ncbi:MAG: metallophosphoesterase family protein [Pedobacter sp.]
MRLIAVGDIHGCIDQLKNLIAKINPCPKDQLVFLGDYIDRGPDSRGVLEFLIDFQKQFPQTVYLRGNHEQLFLDALTESAVKTGVPLLYTVSELWTREIAWMDISEFRHAHLWFQNHGDLTLKSYDIESYDGLIQSQIFDAYRRALKTIPREHIKFLASTKLWYESDQYLFVHAGIASGKRIADQDPYELLWSREGFWRYKTGWNRCVVHGHTPILHPRTERLEISLNTGAGAGGQLTGCDVHTGKIWQS